MKKQLRTYFRDVIEIQVLNDILTSYSHAKVDKIFKYESIRILFEFFIDHNKDHFLSNFRDKQRDTYEDTLRELVQKFELEATGLASAQGASII